MPDKEKVWIVLECNGGVPSVVLITRDEKRANDVYEKCVIDSGDSLDPDDENEKEVIEDRKDELVFSPKSGLYFSAHGEEYDCYLYEEEIE